jgi:UDP-N-acetylmuramoyl-L-alanyl-D-glutamate--2,6-diaminopimelate ligase
VIAVFGSGGDRDPSKRAPMGQVASRLADLVVLTSDNPRHEDPAGIIAAVKAGLDPARAALIQPDRRAAIAQALSHARAGDIVVIAGKGHETTQTVGDVELPFDDRIVAAELLADRHGDAA